MLTCTRKSVLRRHGAAVSVNESYQVATAMCFGTTRKDDTICADIAVSSGNDRATAAQSILAGFREHDVYLTQSDLGRIALQASAGMCVRFQPVASFVHAGKATAARLALNKRVNDLPPYNVPVTRIAATGGKRCAQPC